MLLAVRVITDKQKEKWEDFRLLLSLGIFNEALMDDAVYKFKRYEDASLEYTGINKHTGERVGGFSGSLSAKEFEEHY